MTLKTVIVDMERHCNNYFNPDNDPQGERKHCEGFLELAENIYKFRQDNKPTTVVSESVLGMHSVSRAVGYNGVPTSWQEVFKGDLAVYKRARFI